MKKKYISMLLMAALTAGTLTGCGDSGNKDNSSSQKTSSENNSGDESTEEGKVINIQRLKKHLKMVQLLL